MGAVGEHAGPRWALVVGGVAALCSATLGLVVLRRTQRALEAAVRSEPLPSAAVELETASAQQVTTR